MSSVVGGLAITVQTHFIRWGRRQSDLPKVISLLMAGPEIENRPPAPGLWVLSTSWLSPCGCLSQWAWGLSWGLAQLWRTGPWPRPREATPLARGHSDHGIACKCPCSHCPASSSTFKSCPQNRNGRPEPSRDPRACRHLAFTEHPTSPRF